MMHTIKDAFSRPGGETVGDWWHIMRSTVYSSRCHVSQLWMVAHTWAANGSLKLMRWSKGSGKWKGSSKLFFERLSSGTELEGEISQGTCKANAVAGCVSSSSLQSWLRGGGVKPQYLQEAEGAWGKDWGPGSTLVSLSKEICMPSIIQSSFPEKI